MRGPTRPPALLRGPWLPGQALTHLVCTAMAGGREGWQVASQEEVSELARGQPGSEGGGPASVTQGVTDQVS